MIHAIWYARLRLRHEPDALQSTLRAVVSTTVDNALRDFASLSSDFDTDVSSFPRKAGTGALVARLTAHTEESLLPPPMYNWSVQVLFFDRGSRGYPGPNGSGLVLVRVDMDTRAADIIWAASISYAQIDTINNTEMYWGLIHSLRRAEAEHLTPLYVAGDIFLIVEHMRRH